jgi:hypothetical protein
MSPINNIFIPTLTDINVPHLSEPSLSEQATNKFLCGYLPFGCNDAKNNDISIATIIWDIVGIVPIAFYTNNSLIVSINDTFATATTPQQFISIAKNTFIANNYSTVAFRSGMSAVYSNTSVYDADDITSPFDILHADQFFPLATPDLSDLLRQGRRRGEEVPVNGSVDRAERWSAIHRTSTLSTVLWQTVNAHAGAVSILDEEDCFLCQLIGITSTQASNLQQMTTSSYAVQTEIDSNYRLSTVLCLLEPSLSTKQMSYWCLHTYTQLWNVYHEQNPYSFFGSYDDSAWGAEQASQSTASTPFPFFPPPSGLETNRTYVPIVPIFETRSKGQCSSDWNFKTQSIQTWMRQCIYSDLGQVSITELNTIAENIWQLGSTITVGGFLVTAKYISHSVGISIGLVPQIIIAISIALCIISNILINLVTSAVHRRSLYQVMRVMVPTSRDPYKVMDRSAPTNTLRLVDSVFDKDISYLKLNNRMIVTLSEYQEMHLSNQDMGRDEIHNQDWSRRQLIKF